MKRLSNILVFPIGLSYDLDKMFEVLNLSDSNEIKEIEHIIIDCPVPFSINVMGWELFELREKMKGPSEDSLIFATNNDNNINHFKLLFENKGFGKLKFCANVEEALNYIYLKRQKS